MDNFEVDEMLKTMEILTDTREQDNSRLYARVRQFSYPSVRQKLRYGDYSARCECLDLSDKIVIERKKELDELAMCFGRERRRFEREIKGAYENGYTIYLLVENANWSMIYNDLGYKMNCRSRLPRQSVLASLRAWQVRYKWHIEFCQQDISGWMINDILYREMKERLTNGNFETMGD